MQVITGKEMVAKSGWIAHWMYPAQVSFMNWVLVFDVEVRPKASRYNGKQTKKDGILIGKLNKLKIKTV
jgi:hypothetical protein